MEDVDCMLAQQWMWDSSILSLRQWSPLLNPDAKRPRANLVWLNLLVLPLEYWMEEGLRDIGNFFRGTLAVDEDFMLSPK